MNRRDFVGSAGSLMAAGYVLPLAQPDEATAIRRAVETYYATYRGRDTAKYRACLTEDYLLLENGELQDTSDDLAVMTANATVGNNYQRADSFDFRAIRVQGDLAYAVYFLSSDISDRQGPRHREWLESMILRRSGAGWRTALLHSTRVAETKD